jgi:hypothetical protein
MSRSAELRAGPIVVTGIVGAVLLFVLIVALQAVFLNAREGETYDKVVAVGDDDVRGLQARQLGVLNSYRWIDEEKGVVGIPIEDAMKLVVREAGAPREPAGD